MGLALAEVQSAALAIETRAASQADNSDMDVFRGEQEGKDEKEQTDVKRGEAFASDSFAVWATTETEKNRKICWAKANTGQKKMEGKIYGGHTDIFLTLTEILSSAGFFSCSFFYQGHMQS